MSLEEPEKSALKKMLTDPPVKKIDLHFPLGLEVTARNLKGVTIKDALDAIYKQYRKKVSSSCALSSSASLPTFSLSFLQSSTYKNIADKCGLAGRRRTREPSPSRLRMGQRRILDPLNRTLQEGRCTPAQEEVQEGRPGRRGTLVLPIQAHFCSTMSLLLID